MPKRRTAIDTSSIPVRESPRKRQRTGDEVDGKPHRNTTPANSPATKPKVSVTTRTKKALAVKTEDHVLATEDQQVSSASRIVEKANKNNRNQAVAAKVNVKEEPDDVPSKSKSKAAKSTVVAVEEDTAGGSTEEQPQKIPRKRKTKEEKEAEAMPLAARSTGLKMFVGAHVSIAKGLENSVTNSLHIGGNAFALFLKSQRKWENPPLKDNNRDAFRKACIDYKYNASSHVVPHGSYLVNLATPDADKAKQSYDAFLDDLKRCELLGIKYYNFHPGATNKEPLPEAIGRLAGNLNRALSETTTVVPLLENMAGHGSIIGSRFSDLRDIIAEIKPEYKSRIGICIDTCHAFAAGYDLRSPDAFKKTFQELDDVVGLQYLRALHINDSKAPFGSKRDLHQNIGSGFLGLRAFHNVMNDARLQNIPLILETPCERPDPNDPTGKKTIDDKRVWAREIKLLESLIGMDAESDEFRQLEQTLSEQGRAEREKMEASIAAREEKAQKKLARELAKGQKSISAMFSGKGATNRKKGKGSESSESELDSD